MNSRYLGVRNANPVEELQTAGMISDAVIEALVGRVFDDCPQIRERVAVFQNYFWEKAGSFSSGRQRERFVQSFEKQMRPLNIFVICRNNHWCMIYIRRRNKVIGFYDPKNIFKLNVFWEKLKNMFLLVGEAIVRWRQAVESHHPQKNSLNCGMFVVGRILELIERPALHRTSFNEDDMPKLREWAYHVLTNPMSIRVQLIGQVFNADGYPSIKTPIPFYTPPKKGLPMLPLLENLQLSGVYRTFFCYQRRRYSIGGFGKGRFQSAPVRHRND